MPTTKEIQNALENVKDQQSFFQRLLYRTLNWPVADAEKIDEIAFAWSPKELNAAGLERQLVEGSIWQIQPAELKQPWGIFLLEFKHEDSLSPRRGMAGVLRKVLRGLVTAGRKNPLLPSWKREHLLFICTYDWKHFRFAYFRSKPDEPRSAKLASFGWTPNTSNRTVCEFNLPALVWPDDPSDAARWVESWARAFDKEPLTRDFFKRFDTALDALKADLEEYMGLNSSEAYTQSQLLLERLIFLYFLQNRGWLNRNRNYLASALKEHAASPEQFSYYQEFLDKLFWTLATAPGSAARFPGIPFLNGGLFDDDEFHQPANLRKVNPPLKVRNGTMQRVFSELLEAFNFTVTEDTPLNQDVAVDPEMLGKVFESIVLHAEAADPDAVAPDKRKATGSYYTPRIVVHFICREVLYQYLLGHLPADGWSPRLKTLLAFDLSDGLDEDGRELLKRMITPDQARKILDLVKPLKCCDPAVGSGAFPVGLMQELVNLRRLLETALNGYRDPVLGPQGSSWLHDTKAQIVENCLFGVDIQQQAIEICRLRLWLSLVVDYDLGLDPFAAEQRQFMEAIDRMSQLPNLEMNFRRGDSLHDHISGVPVVILPDRASRHTAEFTSIAKLGADLHKAKKAERKRKLRLDILEKRLELSRKIVTEELQVLRQRDSALDRLFGDEESDAEKRKRNRREIDHLEQALTKIEADQKALDKLRQREADPQFYPKLRKLEGADFDSPFNFAWSIDFPGVFSANGGFDVIVGNPPFVTARNPKKRELWRQRWPRVCAGTYQLVCPFVELGFELQRHDAEIGFIVSNAFARREFGIPLVERFLPSIDLQKIVDCSGLMFPGHGTPTCLIFAKNTKANESSPIRVTVTLPGGGDLRTAPEDSELWKRIAEHHDETGYADSRISVHDWDRSEFLHWPLNLDYDAFRLRVALGEKNDTRLEQTLDGTIGRVCFTGADEIYFVPPDTARRAGIELAAVSRFVVGDGLRDWTHIETTCICPYDKSGALIAEEKLPLLLTYLGHWKDFLRNRLSYKETQEARGLTWWEYSIVFPNRIRGEWAISLTEIATHNHAAVIAKPFIANRANPLVEIDEPRLLDKYHFTTAILNSPVALLWLKQVCFSKREAEDAESGTYYEFAGGKVQQLPIPSALPEQLQAPITEISRKISDHANRTATLALTKIFEKPDEAYHDWNNNIPTQGPVHSELALPFNDSNGLRKRFEAASVLRHSNRTHMIALQEEMDWLIYVAYGLLSTEEPATGVMLNPEPLEAHMRPFCLFDKGGRDYGRALSLIPRDWSPQRRALWETRLKAIRDCENIRRIEQAVYKRRWDEQWKVGNQWRSGEIAYAAEFIDAFEWWLKEKAEWWLEQKKSGGPVDINEWTKTLWSDGRVQAAWPVVAEQYALLEHDKACEKADAEGDPVPPPSKPACDSAAFARTFRRVVEEETVPAGFPFGTDYDELTKKLGKPIPAQLKKVRGKLNVPRERFHSVARGQYAWAGLQFRSIPKTTRSAAGKE